MKIQQRKPQVLQPYVQHPQHLMKERPAPVLQDSLECTVFRHMALALQSLQSDCNLEKHGEEAKSLYLPKVFPLTSPWPLSF